VRAGFSPKGFLMVKCGCCVPEKIDPCPFCKSECGTIRVQGHDQCVDCYQVIENCCEGETQEISEAMGRVSDD
jgi:hypothetical protein